MHIILVPGGLRFPTEAAADSFRESFAQLVTAHSTLVWLVLFSAGLGLVTWRAIVNVNEWERS